MRWLLAAGAAFGLALVSMPMIVSDGVEEVSAEAAAPEPPADLAQSRAACDPKGKPANLNFTLKDMSGKDVSLAAYKGKVILLDFWATWCGPCKYEIPGFVELYSKYRDRGLVVLGISVDDTIDKLKPFAAQYKMNYPVLVGLDRDDVQDAYGPIWGIPTTFIIGRNGQICRKHTGMATKQQFEKEILALLD
jgi:peroxiredoxin